MGKRPSNPLEAALAHLRGGYEASPGNEEGGWFARLQFEEDELREWARLNGFLGGEHELIAAGEADGIEHRVLFDSASGRWLKCTHPETYGGAPSISYDLDPVTNRPVNKLVLGKATPMQYLERWALFNEAFGDDVQLVRVIAVGYGLSLMVSQRDITGTAPEFAQIDAYFAERGFAPLPNSQFGYYRAADGLIALDAHQANLVMTTDGVVPIDIPIFRAAADRDVAQWLRRQGL